MTSLLKTLKQDWSLSATVVGFLAVLISYSGPLIIFFQAAQKAQVSSSSISKVMVESDRFSTRANVPSKR